jgi:hypothetical protein
MQAEVDAVLTDIATDAVATARRIQAARAAAPRQRGRRGRRGDRGDAGQDGGGYAAGASGGYDDLGGVRAVGAFEEADLHPEQLAAAAARAVDGADGGFAAAVGDVTGHCARTLPPSLSVDVPAATPSAAQGGGAAGAATLRVMLGSDPLDEFDRAYWPMVLPHLFPYGTGAPPPGMHVNVWAGALLQRDPRRFALDKEFLFVAANQHLRHAWQRRAGLMVTAQGARVRQLAGLTASDVSDAFKVLTGTKRRAAASEGARALCSAVHGVNARIPGTPFAKARLYPRILAGIMRYGPIAYMVNFNPADIDHPLRCVRHCPSPGAFRDLHLHATCLFVCIDLRASPSSPPPSAHAG